LFIQGGTKFGGRYPDIIINKYDVIRALNIIHNEILLYEDPILLETPMYLNKIVFLVRKILNTDKSMIFEMVNGLPDPTRSLNHRYNSLNLCESEINKNSIPLTNIMGLQFLSNDCREHGWLTGFVSYVFQLYCCKKYNKDCKNEIRILYTSSYVVYDDTKEIIYDQDHVFAILINKNNQIFVVDAFYINNKDTKNMVVFNKNEITEINKKLYKNYKYDNNFLNKINDSSIPFLSCGEIYIENKKKYKIITIPKIYNNTNTYFDTSKYNLNENNILIYNDVLEFDEDNNKPKFFDEWCNRKKTK